MERRFKHVLWFVFRVDNTEVGQAEEKGVYGRPKVLVLRKDIAVCDTACHRVVEGAAKEFRGGKERGFQ